MSPARGQIAQRRGGLEGQNLGIGIVESGKDEEIGGGQREEAVLTEDLKEKVKMLESEWMESLGSVFEEIKERVGRRTESVPME